MARFAYALPLFRPTLKNDADSHHGGDDWNPVPLRKGAKLSLRLAQKHAASRTDQGSFGFFKLIDDLLDLHRMALDRGLIGTQENLLRVFEFCDRRILDVDGHIYQHRALAPGVGDIKRLLENPGNLICVLHQIAVFYKGFHRARDVRLLEYVASQKLAVYLAGNAD